ncbi:dystrobrevin beta-like isoform X2 [Xenia sp. Carnegie-2017]|uniref:dystrobrevin beta-like isoform X2 n=1 Tax=Xenia sp. Carnegie-2017 TaxID=2897299 RepID=UPI001F04A313|nr:dystrobrevin beta-like isoform X2 [Xenia sp. Carnegie-2017]
MPIFDATTSPTLQGNIENESIPREQAEHMLQDLINEMNAQNFDSIQYASQRTGSKLFFLMTKTNLHLVDIYNMIEAFRENRLHTMQHDVEIHESKLEAVLSSIFYALNKRIPSTTDIDVEKSIALVKQWLLYAYDSEGNDRVQVLSVKTSLSMLCAGRLVDKLRYVFSQVSEENGKLNFAKFEAYLKEILKLPEAVGESPTFGFNEDVVNSFFRPTGPLRKDSTTLEHFLDCIWASNCPPSLLWLAAFHRIINDTNSNPEPSWKIQKKPVPKLPEYYEEVPPNQLYDISNVVPPVEDFSTMNGGSHSTPSSSGKISDPDSFDSRIDDEHKLIARYAARLADNTDAEVRDSKAPTELRRDLEENKTKRKIINDLQSKNRELLETIRNLREIRDNSTDKPNASGVDSAQIAELKGLRQKKDELELKMSGLQETRKELMSQLEGLMSILKAEHL